MIGQFRWCVWLAWIQNGCLDVWCSKTRWFYHILERLVLITGEQCHRIESNRDEFFDRPSPRNGRSTRRTYLNMCMSTSTETSKISEYLSWISVSLVCKQTLINVFDKIRYGSPTLTSHCYQIYHEIVRIFKKIVYKNSDTCD